MTTHHTRLAHTSRGSHTPQNLCAGPAACVRAIEMTGGRG
jgi:hypothetical protein